MDDRGQFRLQVATWIKAELEKSSLSQAELAKAANLAPSTIHRYLGHDATYKGTPKAEHLFAIGRVLRSTPPMLAMAVEPGSGFRESDVAPLTIDRPESPLNISYWTIRNNAMQLLGYMQGDQVVVDASLKPRDGDAVICNLLSPDGRTAETAFRLLREPGYLLPASPNAADYRAYEAGKTAAVFGVVIESHRKRLAG